MATSDNGSDNMITFVCTDGEIKFDLDSPYQVSPLFQLSSVNAPFTVAYLKRALSKLHRKTLKLCVEYISVLEFLQLGSWLKKFQGKRSTVDYVDSLDLTPAQFELLLISPNVAVAVQLDRFLEHEADLSVAFVEWCLTHVTEAIPQNLVQRMRRHGMQTDLPVSTARSFCQLSPISTRETKRPDRDPYTMRYNVAMTFGMKIPIVYYGIDELPKNLDINRYLEPNLRVAHPNTTRITPEVFAHGKLAVNYRYDSRTKPDAIYLTDNGNYPLYRCLTGYEWFTADRKIVDFNPANLGGIVLPIPGTKEV